MPQKLVARVGDEDWLPGSAMGFVHTHTGPGALPCPPPRGRPMGSLLFVFVYPARSKVAFPPPRQDRYLKRWKSRSGGPGEVGERSRRAWGLFPEDSDDF